MDVKDQTKFPPKRIRSSIASVTAVVQTQGQITYTSKQLSFYKRPIMYDCLPTPATKSHSPYGATYFNFLVMYAETSAQSAPMKRLTAIAFGPLCSSAPMGASSSASSGLFPASST